MSVNHDVVRAVLERCERGEVSAPMATMQLLLASSSPSELDVALGGFEQPGPALTTIRGLLRQHAAGCATISDMHQRAAELEGVARNSDVGVEQARRLFDRWASESEEASVAWYSLGSAEILARATQEVVDVLERWGVLGSWRTALEIGCGIGRVLTALAPRLGYLVGLDVAPGMLRAAERHTQGVKNVRLMLTDGRNLRALENQSFDLVYSVDAFPYLVRAGSELVSRHFHDVAHLLRPGGDFVLFNYAYGRARSEDAAEVRELAASAGLAVVRCDETPFALWDAVGFHLRKENQP